MQFKKLAAVPVFLAMANAAAIPSAGMVNGSLESPGLTMCWPVLLDPAVELYQCASTIGKRDKRCGPKKREPEPDVELYACAPTVGIGKRCPPEKRIPLPKAEPAELYGCASNTKRDIYGRCPEAPQVQTIRTLSALSRTVVCMGEE